MTFRATCAAALLLCVCGAPERATAQARDTLRIAFVGDINFARSLARTYLFTGRGAEVLAGVRDSLRAADIAVGNLESILLDRGLTADTNSAPQFAGPVGESLPILRDAGFDVIGTANNHAWDFGRRGIVESTMHLDTAGFAHTGTGPDLDRAYRPIVIRRNGWTVAFFSLTFIFNYEDLTVRGHAAECCVAWADTGLMREKIRAVRDSAGADLVMLFVHAGMEYRLVPERNVIQMFRGLVRHSGADAVIGHHPHVPQGWETVDGKPIVYSLGNFVFRQRTAWTNRGLWAALTYFPDRNYRLALRPLAVGYTPSFAGGRDSAATMARVDSSSRIISRLPGVRPRRNVARP
ncbi:MAG: hypothetical protein A2085_08910 [Gemmatimonadetes bacterium GWC2_71_10]|nr:MAG: hypothetical protein A2085_08910 [Gemmatimonadetes bacterium GWC2_71_10]